MAGVAVLSAAVYSCTQGAYVSRTTCLSLQGGANVRGQKTLRPDGLGRPDRAEEPVVRLLPSCPLRDEDSLDRNHPVTLYEEK